MSGMYCTQPWVVSVGGTRNSSCNTFTVLWYFGTSSFKDKVMVKAFYLIFFLPEAIIMSWQLDESRRNTFGWSVYLQHSCLPVLWGRGERADLFLCWQQLYTFFTVQREGMWKVFLAIVWGFVELFRIIVLFIIPMFTKCIHNLVTVIYIVIYQNAVTLSCQCNSV